MVQDIDFLPASYKHERERSRKRVSRRITLIVFLSFVVAGTWQQRQNRLALEAQRDRLQMQAARMLAQLGDPAKLEEQIHRCRVEADLLAQLRLRVSATRVLAAVVCSRPKYVCLTRCVLSIDKGGTYPSPPAVLTSKKKPPAGPQAEPKLPTERDLQAVREEAERTVQVVSVEGLAPNDLAISSYIARLHDTGLFEDVQLQYSDAYEYGEHVLRSFEISLRLRRPKRQSRPKTPPPSPDRETTPSPPEASSPIAAVGSP
ncbi:MAG TPA: hypothetical protein EYP14_12715 [Planctomycetaceae bacterium]|nr:hypothetical protein [Planctomycetaceae bacterium]